MENPKCKNCKLFDPQNKLCQVIVLHESEKINLPVDENDTCFYEQEFKAIDPAHRNIEKFKIDVQQVKVWVEDPTTGEKCKQGKVMIEYPVGFFNEGT